MTAPDSLDGTDPLLRGVGLDAQTRCAHYATARDVVALRFACCPAYWSCHRCHAELTDHPAVPVPADALDVVAAVRFAGQHGLRVEVGAGGLDGRRGHKCRGHPNGG